MSIDSLTYRGFKEELSKIAIARPSRKMLAGLVARRAGKATQQAGKATQQAAKQTAQSGKKALNRGWEDLGGWKGKPGTWREKLPVGGKSFYTGATAAMVPSAMSREDATGRDRSRGERAADLAGGTVGALVGTGAMLGTRFGQRHKLLGSYLGGGLVGSSLGAAAASLPFRSGTSNKNSAGVSIPAHEKQKMLRRAIAPSNYPQVSGNQ